MDNNDISIVLAVYNGEKYISILLDSVLAQTGVNLKEIIIIDDTSTDSSVQIVKTYQEKHDNITIVTNTVNLGPIASFIKGASLATSDYIAFADQDDIWRADKLSLSLNLLKKIDTGNKPAMVFTDLEMIDENGKHLHPSFWQLYNIKPANNNFFTVLFANIATGCTMVINKKMRAEFIAMPLNAQMHDHWLMLIATSIGNWGYLNERTVLYRAHGSSVTDKSKITLRKKASNFLEASFSKDPDFLAAYIQQAILFKATYGPVLNPSLKKQLEYFIGLKNASGFTRKLRSKGRFLLHKWI